MEGMEYFMELFEGLPRGGPGDNKTTAKAFSYMKEVPDNPYILDIGCGPGMQTRELARLTSGRITAIDLYQRFLDQLEAKAREEGVLDQINIKRMSMLEMDFEPESFDIIWSEGAIYFMGFEKGLQKCHELVKKGGYVAVSEAVWLTDEHPQPLLDFWNREYPGIDTVPGKIKAIERAGLEPLANFTLPKDTWFTHFFNPMKHRLEMLKTKYKENDLALEVFKTCGDEIEQYDMYSEYYGYQFFVLQRPF